VVDGDKNVIMTLRQQAYLDSDAFRAVLAQMTHDGTQTLVMLGQEYVVVNSSSISLPLSYIFIIPSSVVMDRVSDVQQKMLLMLLLVLGAGAGMIYWLMHINYDPISELVKLAGRVHSSGRPQTELDTIRTAIRDMEETTSFLRHKVEVSKPIVHEHMIVKLLNGNIGVRDDLGDLVEVPALTSGKGTFAVVKFVFLGSEIGPLGWSSEMLKDLLVKFPPALTVIGSYRPNAKTVILIVQADVTEATLLEEQLTVLYHYLAVKWDVEMAVGIGSCYPTVDGIATSYFESSTAADYLCIKGLEGVRHFVQIDFMNSIVQWYPEQHMESLAWYLQQWDVEKIESTLNEIANKIKSEDTPIYLVKCLCFNILNMLIREIYQVKKCLPHLREEYFDIVALTQFETIDSLIEEVLRICHAGEMVCRVEKFRKSNRWKPA
jgi:hypothetical protein